MESEREGLGFSFLGSNILALTYFLTLKVCIQQVIQSCPSFTSLSEIKTPCPLKQLNEREFIYL